jgi:sortase A
LRKGLKNRPAHGRGRTWLLGSARATVGVIAAMVLGVALIAYPFVSNWLSRIERDKVQQSYEQAVEDSPEEDLSGELQAAQQYNEDLLRGTNIAADPFDPNKLNSYADQRYWSLLNIGDDGVMGTLTIPKLEVSLPIYHGTNDDVLQKGVGHMATTSLPVGGPSTHAVLAGHTGLPSMVVFDRLDTLSEGDYFVIHVLGEDHAYRVYSIEMVLPDQTDSLAIQLDRDLVTLVTCTPYGVNDHRLLVHAERCDVPAEYYQDNHGVSPAESAGNTIADPVSMFSIAGGAVAVAGSVFLLVQFARARSRKR